MGDRSGGREVKGASLKKSKKNPGGVNARGKKAEKTYTGAVESAVTPLPGPELYIDCGAALLSRQFERDRDRVLERGKTDGDVAAIVLWFSDVEKQQLLSDICKQKSGYCYNVVGVHPDNIDKTNKRSHETWMLKVEEIARKPECVGILSGYNLGRDLATHFAQESLLKTSCALADKLQLPLVMHVADGESLIKSIDILRAEGWTSDSHVIGEGLDNNRRVILHDAMTACGGEAEKMTLAVEAGFFCSLSAAGLTDPDEVVRTKASACVACISRKQLLVCTDSPWRTPQNLPDAYLRTLRNEPSNLPSVVVALSGAVGCDVAELGLLLRSNSTRAFGMNCNDNSSDDEVNDEPEHATSCAQDPVSSKVKNKAHKNEENAPGENVKGRKKSKAALLQIFASNDKKKKELEDASKNSFNSEDDANAGECAGRAVQAPSGSALSSHFSCHKCRAFLFSQTSVLSHALDAVRTIFKVGEEGLCKSTVFLSYISDSPDRPKSSPKDRTFNIDVCGVTAECGSCGIKLGKFSQIDSPCPCGILVPGPALRINSNKVDYVDCSADADTLAERSRAEAATSNLQDELEDKGVVGVKDDKKEKKKKMKSENKGNFSSYRNKSFVRNASRPLKDLLSDGEEEKEEDDDDDSGSEVVPVSKPKKNKKAPAPLISSSDEEDD